MNSAAQFVDSYREMAARGASRVGLVVALYETLITDFRRSAQAIRQGDVELRHKETEHALAVLQQLQGSLDMQNGGEPARQLDNYYNSIRAQLLRAVIDNSASALESLSGQLIPVRDAWMEVDKADSAQGAGPDRALPNGPAPSSSSAGWRV